MGTPTPSEYLLVSLALAATLNPVSILLLLIMDWPMTQIEKLIYKLELRKFLSLQSDGSDLAALISSDATKHILVFYITLIFFAVAALAWYIAEFKCLTFIFLTNMLKAFYFYLLF